MHPTTERPTQSVQIMFSMLSSLHLQYQSKYLLLQCHSNWHKLLREMASFCSPVSPPIVHCACSLGEISIRAGYTRHEGYA